MQQQYSKRGIMGVLVMFVAISVGVSVQADSKATGACQCQEVIPMATRTDTAAHPVSLGSRLVQGLDLMYCAQMCLLQETTLELMQPYAEARQRAAIAIQETVNHLDTAALKNMLTPEEETRLETFKRAFAAFQDRSSDVASMALLAESPTETAAARTLSAGKGQIAFDQVDAALQQLVARLGGAEPSVEAVKAELGFPSVGTTWVRKIVVHGEGKTITRTDTVLEEATHGGRPVYRISDGTKIRLYDKATGNWTANVREGMELQVASPYVATYAFPLWEGKIWQARFTYKDRERERTFFDVPWLGRVMAYEEVSVPAGTFKTFKVEGTDLNGVQLVMWYAPKLNTIVRSIFERLPDHYLGPEKFTSELIEYAAK